MYSILHFSVYTIRGFSSSAVLKNLVYEILLLNLSKWGRGGATVMLQIGVGAGALILLLANSFTIHIISLPYAAKYNILVTHMGKCLSCLSWLLFTLVLMYGWQLKVSG